MLPIRMLLFALFPLLSSNVPRQSSTFLGTKPKSFLPYQPVLSLKTEYRHNLMIDESYNHTIYFFFLHMIIILHTVYSNDATVRTRVHGTVSYE